jgi:hypothetical protein
MPIKGANLSDLRIGPERRNRGEDALLRLQPEIAAAE